MIWEHQNGILGDATAAGLDPITANNYWGWNEVPIPGNLQFPTAGATTTDVGVYPLGYGWTDQAISNSSTITLSDYNNQPIYGFDRIEQGLKVSFPGAPHNLVVVSEPTYASVGNTRTVTFNVNKYVTIPAKTELTFIGQAPPAISSLAFVLPQQTDEVSVPTGKMTTMHEYIAWSYHNSLDKLYAGIYEQLDWYREKGYLSNRSGEETVILTMQQSTAELLDGNGSTNASYAKQFSKESWGILSKDTGYTYGIKDGLLVTMKPPKK